MSNTPMSHIYTFDADALMSKLATGDWASCWNHLQQLLENLTVTMQADANISLQTDLADAEKKQYVAQFGALAGELFRSLLSDPLTKLPDKNFEGLIFCHEALHGLFFLFGEGLDIDAPVTSILQSGKDLTETQQKKLLLLLSMNTHLDIVAILKRVELKYPLVVIFSV